jgi:hypothetical protein
MNCTKIGKLRMARILMAAVRYDTSVWGFSSFKLLDFCCTECTSREGMAINFHLLIMSFDTMHDKQSGSHHYKNSYIHVVCVV